MRNRIVIGSTYRFTKREGCGEPCPDIDPLCGGLVVVLDAADCVGCWYVRDNATGRIFEAFTEELDPVDRSGEVEFVSGDVVIALEAQPFHIVAGKCYTVEHVSKRGEIAVSHHGPYGVEPLHGWYDPANFRRA